MTEGVEVGGCRGSGEKNLMTSVERARHDVPSQKVCDANNDERADEGSAAQGGSCLF